MCWRFGTICSIFIGRVASEFCVLTFRNNLFHLHTSCCVWILCADVSEQSVPSSYVVLRLKFVCWRFGTICSVFIRRAASEVCVLTFRNNLFHLHTSCCFWILCADVSEHYLFHLHSCSHDLWRWNSVPKRRNIKCWQREITQKKEYNKNNVIPVQAKKAYEECSFFGRPFNVVCIYIYDTMSLFNVTYKLLEYFELDVNEINWLILFEHFCGWSRM
jgi:hypothetical protein